MGLERRDGRGGQSGRTWRFGDNSGDLIRRIAGLEHVDRAEASPQRACCVKHVAGCDFEGFWPE